MGAKTGPYLKHIKGKRIIVPQFGDSLAMLACAKKGAIVTGVDLSSEQVRLARKAAKYIGVDVELVEADWQDLPRSISKNYFDLVVTECGIFIDPQTGRMDEKRLESAWKMRQTDRFGFSPAFTDH